MQQGNCGCSISHVTVKWNCSLFSVGLHSQGFESVKVQEGIIAELLGCSSFPVQYDASLWPSAARCKDEPQASFQCKAQACDLSNILHEHLPKCILWWLQRRKLALLAQSSTSDVGAWRFSMHRVMPTYCSFWALGSSGRNTWKDRNEFAAFREIYNASIFYVCNCLG